MLDRSGVQEVADNGSPIFKSYIPYHQLKKLQTKLRAKISPTTFDELTYCFMKF